jgi:LuxR family maltose regulon positive regulatory protein
LNLLIGGLERGERSEALSVTLLRTKLYIPPVRVDLVPRPHLVQRINDGLRYPAMLISASAGFGKTTLLSEWHTSSEGSGVALGWLSLDEDDNDFVRFMLYLIGALETLKANVGDDALALLQSTQTPGPKMVLTPLINALSRITSDLAVVLDDYHCITSSSIHEAVTFLLEHLPPQVHIIIACRADPPLPLARLRARGLLFELRADDLRLTPDEAAMFLRQTFGLALSEQEISALEARTEGWIAGLQLAALAMRGQHDIAGFVAAFTGSNRYILDYLAEEVLRREPAHTQDFLLETAVLERLSGPLCRAVTGRADAELMLLSLEQANLFTVPLDADRHWFRYHHLFADVLRHHLRRIQPDRVPELHRRASTWYEQQGYMPEAIRHALAAADFERAADLIGSVSRKLLAASEVTTLRGWIEVLPDGVVRARPLLSLMYAWVLALGNQVEAAEARLQDALQLLSGWNEGQRSEAEYEALLGEARTLEALAAVGRGDFARAIDLSRQALDHTEADNVWLRSLNIHNLGLAYRSAGKEVEAMQALIEASRLAQAAGNLLLTLFALSNLAALQEIRGELRNAARTCQQLLQLATGKDGQPLPLAGLGHLGLGKLCREWNELDKAARHLRRAIELGQQSETEGIVTDSFITLALVYQARRDFQAAHDMLQKARQFVERWGFPQMHLRLAAFEARLWLAQGDLERAVHWARESGLSVNDAPSEALEIEHTTLARILTAQGAVDEAAYLLARMLTSAEAVGRMGRVMEILVLQSLVYHAQGDSSRALSTLERALSIAGPEGYVRLFADEGPPMAELLGQVSRRGSPVSHHATRLLDAFDRRAPASAVSMLASEASYSSPLEALSEREFEVLSLIADGLSNREIAEKLVISIPTVKKHIENIHDKLNVHSRTQALARARELGLL